MSKKKLIISIGLSILMIAMLVLCIIFITKPFSPKYDGEITVEVVNLEGEIIKTKDLHFNNGEKLRDLISNNFENFVIEESEYGAYMISIETIKQDNDNHIYIALYLNGEYATSGLDTLEYTDGSVISFKAEKW